MFRIVNRYLVSKTTLVALCVTGLFVYIVVNAQVSSSSVLEIPTAQPHVVVSETNLVLPQVSAYAVFDVETGAVLHAQNAATPYPIASVTKLITAAAVLDTTAPYTKTTLTWSDVATEGRAGKLEPAQDYTYHELLFPLLLESSNDAATALERDGTLLTRMNTLAKKYGATATELSDASGLSDGNVSSAADLAVIVSGLYTAEPHLFDITRLKQYVGPYTGWVNNNPLVAAPGYVGGKHGYTTAAGRTIVALFRENIKGGERTLGYVVLGSSNLAADVAKLRALTQESVHLE